MARAALAVLVLTLLGACQPGWVRLDGVSADSAELQRARSICKIDDRLAALEASRGDDDVGAGADTSNQARMLRIEDFELRRMRVEREIDACMARAGWGKS